MMTQSMVWMVACMGLVIKNGRPDPGAPLQSLPAELFALVLLVPLIGMLHELGHAAAAPLAGYRVTSLGLGLGAPLLRRVTPRGWVLWLGRWPLAGGACVAIPASLKARPWLYHLGGLAAQALLALLLHPFAEEHWVLARAETFNLLVLAWNLLPWRWRGLASDGWHLVTRLGSSRGRMLALGRRPVLERLERFEGVVGSPVGVWYARLGLAWLEVLVGRPRRAEAFLAEPLPDGLGPEDRGILALRGHVQVAWLLASGDTGAALEDARAWRARLGSAVPDAAEDLTTLAVARALVRGGQPGEALRVLASLAGVSGAIGREATAIMLAAALQGEDLRAVVHAAWRLVERMPGPFFDPVLVVRGLTAAAALLPAEDPAARRFAREAGRAREQLLAWAEHGDRAGLAAQLEAQEPNRNAG
jgi:hypothetical protein